MKKYFNINLVEVESHIVLKNSICDNIFGHCNVLSPMLTFIWKNQILFYSFVYYVIGPIILLHLVVHSLWGTKFEICFW
jgi:hypothetical protein